KQAAPGWTLRDLRGPANASLPKTNRGLCVKNQLTVGVPRQRRRRCWWTHVLRQGPRGRLPARRVLRGQNLEGSQACRSACRAADEVRAGDQSESGQADRVNYSAERAGESGQGDQMTPVGNQRSKKLSYVVAASLVR